MARILLIEDDEMLRTCLRDLLEFAGHEVVEAADGQEGLDRFQTGPVDLVVTDLVMPKREGLSLILEVRQDYPKTKIIAISGGGRIGKHQLLEVAKSYGADRTLLKPFKPKELFDAVDECLKPALN